MNKQEFSGIAHIKPPARVIRASDLSDATPRTLMLGVGLDEVIEHTYLTEDGAIHSLRYKEPDP